MNQLFFTHPHRRSTKNLRLHYGLDGMKYIIQMYEGEINGHREREGLPNEYQYEFEQEMLKHVHDLKNQIGYVIDNCSSRMLNFSGTTEKHPEV